MNIHSLLDVISVDLSRVVTGDKKMFSQSIDSPAIVDHMDAVVLQSPDFHGLGQYEVTADTLIGRVDPAFLVYQWLGSEHPTILYQKAPKPSQCPTPNSNSTTFDIHDSPPLVPRPYAFSQEQMARLSKSSHGFFLRRKKISFIPHNS